MPLQVSKLKRSNCRVQRGCSFALLDISWDHLKRAQDDRPQDRLLSQVTTRCLKALLSEELSGYSGRSLFCEHVSVPYLS